VTDRILLPIDEELYGRRAFGQLDGPIHWPSLTADERASYADTASPTAGVDWLRALRDVELRLHELASNTQCTAQTHRDSVLRNWQPPA